jgi:hypothetical protein
MRKLMLAVAALGIAIGTAWTFSGAAQKDDKDKEKKPKYTIKEVMKKAHAPKDAILKKVQADKATKEEMKELLVMYQSLEMNKPPKGEEKEWKKRTKALVDAANKLVKDEKDTKEAKELLAKAANCKTCHDVHKGAPAK